MSDREKEHQSHRSTPPRPATGSFLVDNVEVPITETGEWKEAGKRYK